MSLDTTLEDEFLQESALRYLAEETDVWFEVTTLTDASVRVRAPAPCRSSWVSHA